MFCVYTNSRRSYEFQCECSVIFDVSYLCFVEIPHMIFGLSYGFDKILDHLRNSMAWGVAATEYIAGIETKLYARHAFPLPRMGKISSNSAEQMHSGLLPIREFAPYKILLDGYYYIQ